MIEIVSKTEYDYLVGRGFQPLQDWRNFHLDLNLRLSLQYELFGFTDFQKQNDKFYHWVWENRPHACEETGKTLYQFSAIHISHILSRGSDRRMAIDPRNVNILSFESHQKWETGKQTEMNIYPMNKLIINLLKKDYK
jgi:hypothetical protein